LQSNPGFRARFARILAQQDVTTERNNDPSSNDDGHGEQGGGEDDEAFHSAFHEDDAESSSEIAPDPDLSDDDDDGHHTYEPPLYDDDDIDAFLDANFSFGDEEEGETGPSGGTDIPDQSVAGAGQSSPGNTASDLGLDTSRDKNIDFSVPERAMLDKKTRRSESKACEDDDDLFQEVPGGGDWHTAVWRS